MGRCGTRIASGKEGGRERKSESEKDEGRWREREIHLEIVSASVWPLAYWN